MFFGHEVKSNNQNKASSMTLETDVKLSQAVLDPAGKAGNKKEPVCLMAEVNGKSFILAVLDPTQSWQCALDLVLASGTAVKFYIRGQGTVHLTGYEIRDDMGDDLEMSMSSSEDEEVDSAPSKQLVSAKKANTPQQAKNIPVKTNKAKSPSSTNGVRPASTNGVRPLAKTNGKPSTSGQADSDENSSDDADFDLDEDEDDISENDFSDEEISSEISDDDDENLSFGEIEDSDDMEDMDDDDEEDDDDDDDDDN